MLTDKMKKGEWYHSPFFTTILNDEKKLFY